MRSMGSTPWNGRALQSGYLISIGGKEVHLDSAVPASRIPLSAKQATSMNIDPCESTSNQTELNLVDQSKQFVAPTSFYASPKPKAKQPR